MRYRVSTLLCVVAAVACSGGDVVQEPIDRVGIYNLTTVEGKALPYTFPNSPTNQLIAESITLNPDKTHIVRSEIRTTDALGEPHASEDIATGTYSISGITLTMTHSTGTVVVQTFTGANELTAHCCGNTTWIYRR